MSEALTISEVTDDDIAALVDLWQRAGLTRPWNNPEQDIAFARSSPAAAMLIGKRAGRIVASVMVGHDGHRGAYYYVASDPDLRGQGLGRAIMAAAEEWLKDQGIWKVNRCARGANRGAKG